MKRIGVLIVLSLLVLACNNADKPIKPDNLISKNKMEHILYDLYIINAAKGVNRKLLEAEGFIPETYVLTKHKIDSIQFADSNAYYAFDSETYNGIIKNVKTKLEKEKKIYEKLEEAEGRAAKKKRDSLDKIKKRKKDSIYQALQKRDSIKKIKQVNKDSIF